MNIIERAEAVFPINPKDDPEEQNDMLCKQIGYKVGAMQYVEMSCEWIRKTDIHQWQSREFIAQLLKEHLRDERIIHDNPW
jgi:hypothetical protein